MTFLVTPEGLDIGPGPLPLDETTARALATALLIALRTKLAKAERRTHVGADQGRPGTSD